MNNLVSIDLETTGIDIANDRIVEIACVKFDGESTIEKCYKVNPLIPITNSEIHGITNADVADKPSFRQFSKGILQFISGCDILTFNGNKFDIPLLYMEFKRAGIEWHYTACKLYDAHAIFKHKESRDLTAAMKFYCNEQMTGAHSALYDAKCTLKVFAEQLRRYDLKDEKEIAFISNYEKPIIDLAGWFDENKLLTRGKSKGTQDKGFIEWMLKLPDLLPDTRKICEEILNK